MANTKTQPTPAPEPPPNPPMSVPVPKSDELERAVDDGGITIRRK